MYKILLCSLLLLSAGCSAARISRSAADEEARKPYVVILSLDAFRWDLASRAHTPTLDLLRGAGTYAEIYPVFPSNTFPSHYSMATGLHPDRHGVVNNKFYDASLGRTLSVFDAQATALPGFWGGEPIWNTAERQGRTANIFMWVGSENEINGRRATVWTPYTDTVSFYRRADWVLEALTRPEEQIPNLVMWYFEEPDATMHTYGPASPQAVAQAEHIDSVLAYFFARVRRSPVFDRINFIVTADHGMADLSPDRYVNLYGKLDSTKVEWTVAYRPFALQVQEDYVQEALRILSREKHLKAYRREKLPCRLRYGSHPTRLSNIVILPQTGWTIDYRPVDKRPAGGAAHGFDPAERAMHMIFYASGPAFRRGYEQRSFQNHNIYLVLCHLLGIEPAPNDGRWRDVRGMFAR